MSHHVRLWSEFLLVKVNLNFDTILDLQKKKAAMKVQNFLYDPSSSYTVSTDKPEMNTGPQL